MALKKLTRFAFAALLLVAGSASLSASRGGQGELSANLNIVKKTKVLDKKNVPGFLAHLKGAARGYGRQFMRILAAKTGEKGKILARASEKAHDSKLLQKFQLSAKVFYQGQQTGFLADHRLTMRLCSFLRASVSACGPPMAWRHHQTAILSDFEHDQAADLPRFALTMCSGASHAQAVPASSLWQRLIRLLKPGFTAQAESAAIQGLSAPVVTTTEPRYRAGRPLGSCLQTKGHNPAQGEIHPGSQMHFTIDLPTRATLLTHGSVGAGSAVRRD